MEKNEGSNFMEERNKTGFRYKARSKPMVKLSSYNFTHN